MSKIQVFLGGLVLAAMAGMVPSAAATITSKAQIVIAGSTGVWQAVALSTDNYNPSTQQGDCPGASFKVHPPCYHYTDSSKFYLNDTRPTLNGLGGSVNQDKADLWIVWDSPTSGTRNVWIYIKPDTIIANRCYFANPRCNITAPTSGFPAPGNKISSTLWGPDYTGGPTGGPPQDVINLFTGTTGPVVNTLSTELRPEDALFEQCRVNSALGAGTAGGNDNLDGLGYSPGPAGGTANAAGVCPAFGASLGQLVGQQILSGIQGSTSAANVLAFNISGTDPFTGDTVTKGSTYYVGAFPIVFVFSRSSTINSGLTGALDATDAQLQTIFGGGECDAEVLGLPEAPINAYLREPLSGTMTTTEMEVFRRPTDTVNHTTLGVSQETGVNAGPGNFSLNAPCGAKGSNTPGNRIRGIGTGEVLNGNNSIGGVQYSGAANTAGSAEYSNDGIAYAFNSFGNMSKFAGLAGYGYLTLDGEDGIGANPGTSPPQELPVCTIPCPENDASFPGWGAGNSYPALRAGKYSAWTLVHMITLESTSIKDLIAGAQLYAVNFVPDFIPYTAVAGTADEGMQIWLTHYQQNEGNGTKIGSTPGNGTFNSNGNPVGGDKGGMAGGCTISTSGITATKDIDYIQANVTEADGPETVTCSKDRSSTLK